MLCSPVSASPHCRLHGFHSVGPCGQSPGLPIMSGLCETDWILGKLLVLIILSTINCKLSDTQVNALLNLPSPALQHQFHMALALVIQIIESSSVMDLFEVSLEFLKFPLHLFYICKHLLLKKSVLIWYSVDSPMNRINTDGCPHDGTSSSGYNQWTSR